jgi:hypothetical protein
MSDDYRQGLISAEQKSQEEYDKAILTLSGSALGLSFIVIQDIVGARAPVDVWAIIAAWGSWAASITTVILSYYLSRTALRKAIAQTDANDFSGGVGGLASKATEVCNISSGVFFIIGVVCLITFTVKNFGT